MDCPGASRGHSTNTGGEDIAPAAAVCYAAPAPVDEYMASTSVKHATPAPVDEYMASASVEHAAPAPDDEYAAAAQVGYAARASVVENIAPQITLMSTRRLRQRCTQHQLSYIALAPVVGAAPIPVVEDIATAHAASYAALAPVVEYTARAGAGDRREQSVPFPSSQWPL